MQKALFIFLLLMSICNIEAQTLSNVTKLQIKEESDYNRNSLIIHDFEEGGLYNYLLIHGGGKTTAVNDTLEIDLEHYKEEALSRTIIKLDQNNNYVSHISLITQDSFGAHNYFKPQLNFSDGYLYISGTVNGKHFYLGEEYIKQLEERESFVLKLDTDLNLVDSLFWGNDIEHTFLEGIEVRGNKIHVGGAFTGFEQANYNRCMQVYDTEICSLDVDTIPEGVFPQLYNTPNYYAVIDMETKTVDNYLVFGGAYYYNAMHYFRMDDNNNVFMSLDQSLYAFFGLGIVAENTMGVDSYTICINDMDSVLHTTNHSGLNNQADMHMDIEGDVIVEFGLSAGNYHPLIINGVEYPRVLDQSRNNYAIRKDLEGNILWYFSMENTLLSPDIRGLEIKEDYVWIYGGLAFSEVYFNGEICDKYTSDDGRLGGGLIKVNVETGAYENSWVFDQPDYDGFWPRVQGIIPLDNSKVKVALLHGDTLHAFGQTIYPGEWNNTILIVDMDTDGVSNVNVVDGQNEAIGLYPNPIHAGERIYCSGSQTANIELFDMLGQRIWQGVCGDSLPDLNTGVYVTRSQIGKRSVLGKIIIH